MVEYNCSLKTYQKVHFLNYKDSKIMSENILRIETKKYTEESVVISSRIPKDMLQDIDFVAKETGRTRNEIISMFLDFALKNTEIIDKR